MGCIYIKEHMVLVDDEDLNILMRRKWNINTSGKRNKRHYVVRKFYVGGGRERNKFLHRVLMGIDDSPDLFIDHINGNTLDNRKSNLRVCSRVENGRNRMNLDARNWTGYTGVYFDKHAKKWKASICNLGKVRHIGLYKTKEEAVLARRSEELAVFGEFAPRNRH